MCIGPIQVFVSMAQNLSWLSLLFTIFFLFQSNQMLLAEMPGSKVVLDKWRIQIGSTMKCKTEGVFILVK